MNAFAARRALIVAALIVVSGCSGGPSNSEPPIASSSLHQQSQFAAATVVPRASFVNAGASFVPPVAPHAVMRSALSPSYVTTKPLLFESDQQGQVVNVFSAAGLTRNAPPVATIPISYGVPTGLAADKAGELYVAIAGGGDTVEIYSKGKTSPKRAISNGISVPFGLAINAKGTLFVSNYSGTITEYPAGGSTPSNTISGQGLQNPVGLALDEEGNLYVADSGASQVFEIAAGSSIVKPLNLQNLTEPQGVAIDLKSGDLWVTDFLGEKVNVYKSGSTAPFKTIRSSDFFPYAIGIDEETGSVAISNNQGPTGGDFLAYKPNIYKPYATETNSIAEPIGLLWAKL